MQKTLKIPPSDIKKGDLLVRLDGNHEIVDVANFVAERSGNIYSYISFKIRGRVWRMRFFDKQRLTVIRGVNGQEE